MSTVSQRLRSSLRHSPVGGVARKIKGRVYQEDHRLLFVFNGASGKWPGMGVEHFRREPIFRETIERCSVVGEELLGLEITRRFSDAAYKFPIKDKADFTASQKNDIVAIAALHMAQCELWKSLGIMPDGVLGVSLGEPTAAYAAGVLTLEEAMRVACSIADAVPSKSCTGRMVFLEQGYHAVKRLCQGTTADIGIIGEFSPISTLLFVTNDDYPTFREHLQEENVPYKALQFDWTCHTSLILYDRQKIENELKDVAGRPATIPYYSSQLGSCFAPHARPDWLFWYGVLSRQCRLNDALQATLRDNYDTFLNIGPRPTFKQWIDDVQRASGRPLCVFDSMRHDAPEYSARQQSLQGLRTRGFGPKSRVHFKVKKTRGNASDAAIAKAKAEINALDADFLRHPYSRYAVLRQRGSVHFFPSQNFWLVLGYDDVAAALRAPEKYSNSPLRAYDAVLTGADPPEHTRARRIVSRYFSPARVKSASDYASSRARVLLRAAGEKQEFDIVSKFTGPLTEHVIGHFLGIGEEKFEELLQRIQPIRSDTEVLFGVLRQFFKEYIEECRTTPGEDLCSRLIAGTGEESFSTEEIVSLMTIVWVAGTETTRTLIAESILLLLANPQVKADILAHRELVTPFVEESLRLSSPVHNVVRLAKEETTIGGTTIPAGAVLKLCLGAANRDSAHFPDPDRIDLQRDTRSPLMFGAGIHRCVGATLARAELRSAIEALGNELPNFCAAEPIGAAHWAKSLDVRSLEQLTIAPR